MRRVTETDLAEWHADAGEAVGERGAGVSHFGAREADGRDARILQGRKR